MFGGGAKKKQPTKARHAGASLSSFGLIDVPGTDEFGNISLDHEDDDDDDLQAELHAIAYGNSKARKPAKKKQLVSENQLQNMVDMCMQDIPSGDEYEEDGLDSNDADLLGELEDLASDDECDEKKDSVSEKLTLPTIIKPNNEQDPCNSGLDCAGGGMLGTIDSRIQMYTAAQTKASTAGESSKARRFGRALTTLNELKRNLKAGKAIREEDIPPSLAPSSTSPIEAQVPSTAPKAIVQPAPENEPQRTAPTDTSINPKTNLITPSLAPSSTSPIEAHVPPTAPKAIVLHEPQNEPHRTGPPDTTINPKTNVMTNSNELKSRQDEIPKQENITNIKSTSNPNLVILQVKSHREKYKAFALQSKSKGDKENAVWGLKAVKLCDMLIKKLEKGDSTDFDISSLPEVPSIESNQNKCDIQSQAQIPPKLQRTFSRDDPIQIPDNPEDIPPPDRTAPVPNTTEEALNQRLSRYRQDESKAKAEGNASKTRRLGRICKQYEEAIKLHKRGKPIPVAELPTPPGFSPIPTSNSNVKIPSSADPKVENFKSNSEKASENSTAKISNTNAEIMVKPKPVVSKQKSLSVQEKQLALLQKRQTLFKSAALEAKRAGQIEQAKEYLRSAKGFDKLIDASKGGLPVDITTLPIPPQSITKVDMGFTLVSREDGMHISEDLDNKSRQEMYLKLESDIKTQIKMCDANQKHFKITGDVVSANKFQQMSEHTKKDLDALRFAFKRGDPVPKFHYEVRAFSIIVCNTELTDHEMELTIENGINYNVPNPKEIDTYCRIEFPYPKETPYKDKSVVIKDTNNPEYKHKIMIPVNIKEKACQRVFKRGAAKVEVWSKGGFLRGDTLLGTATVKLSPLETSCTLHDTFPLMEGRRAVGGKVEVIIKLRNAVVTKQVEKREEKWLVISFR